MRTFLLLLLSILFVGHANANNNKLFTDRIVKWLSTLEEPKDNDWSKFYQLKNEVKDIIVDVSKNNAKKHYKTEQDVGSVVIQYVARLQDLKRKYPMEFNIVTTHREEPKEHEPKLFLTIVVTYKDELSEITWGFNTLFFDGRIEFYSSTDDGKTKKTFEDLYNYLTLYEA